MGQGKIMPGETQAGRVWNLVCGTYDFNRYWPPEADVVKNEWDEDIYCARLWDRIWNMCNEFMKEEDAEECRNCIYDLTEALAIKMFEYRRILKNIPMEPDRIVFEIMVGESAPEDYGWDDGKTVEVLFKKPEVKRWEKRFCAAWERLENRLNMTVNDPDVLAMVNAHRKLLELFSRQAFRYGQIFRM